MSFHSDIEVHEDATLTVNETIQVTAEGNQIKRGIFRDFPTRYRDASGNRYHVGFAVEQVLRDGHPEPFAVESAANGKRVRIGQADILLEAGTYTYQITYTTDFQIGYFGDHDELYWNVTGNGWAFPIDRASATVTLPDTVPGTDINIEAYTGASGATGQKYRTWFVSDRLAHVETTAILPPAHGLTMVVSWPPGHVYQPTPGERFQRMLSTNRSVMAALIGLVCLLGYYVAVWVMVGADPDKGTIVPLYHPPEGISPAAARYLSRMGYDNKCLAAAMINLAVNGWLTLSENKGVYTAQRGNTTDAAALTPEELALSKNLFGTRKKVRFKPVNHRIISKVVKSHEQSLALAYEKTHFLTNREHWWPGLALLALTLAGVVATSENMPEAAFMCVWLSFWSVGVILLGIGVIASWKQVFTGRSPVTSILGALFMTGFATPFFAGEGFGAWQLASLTSPIAVGILMVMALVLLVFYHLLKAPTLLGRKVMDKLEGFKMYLSVAETDRLAYMHPPNRTPELFEAYLPYALALDVEQEWAEYFFDVLERAAQVPQEHHSTTRWYRSRSGQALGAAAFAGAIGGALSSAISSSSSAPGSRSGSGGGGSSGGGGGGGGGGGW